MALTENDVVEACSEYLRRSGYEIESTCSTAERGVDIVALNLASGSRLRVEAKGGTSSKAHTARFGQTFSPGQARSHVSRALFEIACMASHAAPGDQVAMAFPSDEHHRRLVEQILPVLQRIPASVLWVSPDRVVQWWRGS